MSTQELAQMLIAHRKWLDGIKGGVRADPDSKGLTDTQRQVFKLILQDMAEEAKALKTRSPK